MNITPVIQPLEAAYTGEEIRNALIFALTAVNEAHHKKFYESNTETQEGEDNG